MIGVICHWDLPVSLAGNPKASKKLLTRWSLTCKSFGFDTLVLVDVHKTGISLGDQEIRSAVFPTLSEARTAYPDAEYIYVYEGGVPLSEFSHPQDNVLYVFGGDYAGKVHGDRDKVLSIRCNGRYPLHAEIAAGIIMHDRYVKLN